MFWKQNLKSGQCIKKTMILPVVPCLNVFPWYCLFCIINKNSCNCWSEITITKSRWKKKILKWREQYLYLIVRILTRPMRLLMSWINSLRRFWRVWSSLTLWKTGQHEWWSKQLLHIRKTAMQVNYLDRQTQGMLGI